MENEILYDGLMHANSNFLNSFIYNNRKEYNKNDLEEYFNYIDKHKETFKNMKNINYLELNTIIEKTIAKLEARNIVHPRILGYLYCLNILCYTLNHRYKLNTKKIDRDFRTLDIDSDYDEWKKSQE